MDDVSRCIYRYPLIIADFQEVMVTTSWAYGEPEVLSVAKGRSGTSGLDLWAVHDDDGTEMALGVYILGTGNPMTCLPQDARFLGTVVASMGFVWHVYTKFTAAAELGYVASDG